MAYDQRTVEERWRVYRSGLVMLAPVLDHGNAIDQVQDRQLIAASLCDSALRWTNTVPGSAPMGNPLLVGDTVFVGLEPNRLCSVSATTGERFLFTSLTKSNSSTGHASPAKSGRVVIATTMTSEPVALEPKPGFLRRIFGLVRSLPTPVGNRLPVVFGVDPRSGEILWRTEVPAPRYVSVSGHPDGTPAVSNGVAYIPRPSAEKVAAIDVSNGVVLWTAAILPSRGSVTVIQGAVLAATADSIFVVLDARTGTKRSRARLPDGD